MKKISILMLGVLIGISLAITSSVYAADIKSLIGKTIQGEFPVKIDGKELSKKALLIDGTSYVPLRVFGEAIGYESTFDAKSGITFKASEVKKMENQQSYEESKEKAKLENDKITADIAEKNIRSDEKFKAILEIKQKIGMKEFDILKYQSEVDLYSKATGETNKKLFYPNSDFETFMKQYTDPLAKAQAEKVELQKQLDDLNALPSPTPPPSAVQVENFKSTPSPASIATPKPAKPAKTENPTGSSELAEPIPSYVPNDIPEKAGSGNKPIYTNSTP